MTLKWSYCVFTVSGREKNLNLALEPAWNYILNSFSWMPHLLLSTSNSSITTRRLSSFLLVKKPGNVSLHELSLNYLEKTLIVLLRLPLLLLFFSQTLTLPFVNVTFSTHWKRSVCFSTAYISLYSRLVIMKTNCRCGLLYSRQNQQTVPLCVLR